MEFSFTQEQEELRREAGLDLDAGIELFVGRVPAGVEAHLDSVASETLAQTLVREAPDGRDGLTTGTVELSEGPVEIGLRPSAAGDSVPAGSS